jgi:hypothetical protein
MPTVRVPIFESIMKGVDGVELNEENFTVTDGYRTVKGGTTGRPGTKQLFVGSGASGFGVDGLFYWPEQNAVMAVGGGEVYQLSYVSRTPVTTSLSAGNVLLNQNRPVSMAVDRNYFYCCNGGRIVYTAPGGTPAYVPDVDAPTGALHIAYLDGYIIAIDNSNKFYWSDVNTGTSWNALSFASAAGSPDNIVALKVYNREIYLFGERTVEVWENDGTTPFSRIPGGMIQSGCSAPYAIIEDENSIYWIDDNRRLVRFAGKSVERLSTKFDRELQSLSRVSDGIASKIEIDGYVFFVFSFREANRTLVYNQTTDDWCEWGQWSLANANYDRWIGNSYCYAEKWGLHLVGQKNKVVVSELRKDYYSDDSSVIRPYRLTGHIDYGTSQLKRSNELRFRAKRGIGLSGRTPRVMLRYKIDNKDWSNIKEFSLGDVGEYNIIVRDHRRKIFRTIQYEFSATDAVDVVFSQAEEDIEVLR